MDDVPNAITTVDEHLTVGDEIFEHAAEIDSTCANCDVGFSVRAGLILFREGWPDGICFCSKSCIAEYFLEQCEIQY